MRLVLRAVPVLLVVLSLAALLAPRRGVTLPLYAARTGLMCGSCHFDPNGGGPRNDFGFAYAKNRHALAPDTTGEWKDLALVNRVGDNFPLYAGVNQRFMLLDNASKSDTLDRIGFYSMENALHLAFQPHHRLTLVYTRDGFDGGSSSKEAFGMFGGLPGAGYVKAGRFRTPFGLRMDDHTVGTRNGFLDFFVPYAFATSNQDIVVASFLPYDPRHPDMGIEAGGSWRSVFGRVAIVNGGTHPLGPGPDNRTQAVALKLGATMPGYQGGISLYDDFHHVADFSSFPPPVVGTRATRWGYYGMTHWWNLTLLGEVAAGTDAFGSEKRNSLAWFTELDWRVTHGINLRARFDRMELARGVDGPLDLGRLNTHNRYAVEGEFLPVPFGEIRWTLRFIEHAADRFPTGGPGSPDPIKDERQGYLQFHFSY